MIRPSLALAALTLALGLASPPLAAEKPSPRQAQACAAARTLVEDVFRRSTPGKTAFSNGAADSVRRLVADPQLDIAAYPPSRWRPAQDGPDIVKPPAAATIRAFKAATPANALDCPAVRDEAGKRGARLDATVEAVAGPKPTGPYTHLIYGLSLPVVSPDGTEALAYAGVAGAPLAGFGGLVLMRRDPYGDWRIVGSLGLWIS